MAASNPGPLLCPILIGRASQLQLFENALAELRSGSGRTVLVAGEAGIGKSRLVAEARSIAVSAQGLRTLQGVCFDYDRSLPYAPFADLFRGLSSERPSTALIPSADAAWGPLLAVFPELATWFPAPTPAPPSDPQQQKQQLFRSLDQVFAALTAEQPLVLVLEDLHWSDESSLELASRIPRRTASSPLLLLLTYRNDEVQPDLRHLLAQLDRLRLATEVALSPLALPEVDAMLRGDAGVAAARGRGQSAAYGVPIQRSNPFFVEELLRSLGPDRDQGRV